MIMFYLSFSFDHCFWGFWCWYLYFMGIISIHTIYWKNTAFLYVLTKMLLFSFRPRIIVQSLFILSGISVSRRLARIVLITDRSVFWNMALFILDTLQKVVEEKLWFIIILTTSCKIIVFLWIDYNTEVMEQLK